MTSSTPDPTTPIVGTLSAVDPTGGDEVSTAILGFNLEVHTRSVDALLSDRLENAKFAGPPEAGGLAPPWRPRNLTPNMSVWRWQAGVGLTGDGAHHLVNYHPAGQYGVGMVQTHRRVRRGEALEVEVWARTRHQPAVLAVSITPRERIAEAYTEATAVIDSTYWKRHVFRFESPVDDDSAVFELAVEGNGQIWVDQVHLRAAGEDGLAADVVDAIGRLRVPDLRFPGGTRAATYRWREGTGPRHLRRAVFDQAHHFLNVYDFGTDEYLSLCHQHGISPHITVNTGSATPDEAAEWAAYIAEWYSSLRTDVPLAYFQIGNEDWGAHEFSHMTAPMYVETLHAYIPGIRRAHPRARIIANVQAHTSAVFPDDERWRPDVLRAVKELGVEVAAIHIYKGTILDHPLEQLTHVLEALSDVDTEIQALADDIRDAEAECTIAVTEWNYLLEAAQHDGSTQLDRSGPMYQETYDARHCLFMAGAIHRFARHSPLLEIANFYTLVGPYGVLRRDGLDVEWTAAADVFELYREALPASRIDVRVDCQGDGVGSAFVDALALLSESGMWIYLVNFHPTRPLHVAVDELRGVPSRGVAISAQAPTDMPIRSHVDVAPDGLVALPPLTVARLRSGT